MLLTLLFAFCLASFTLCILYPIAIKVGFVDRPTSRKLHQGNIPLIGGVSIFLPIVILLFFVPDVISNSQVFICCSGLLLLIGLIDDKFDLSVFIRVLLITAISIWLVVFADIKIHHLGDLIGFGDLFLNNAEILFTVIAIIGAVTAFNMVDGLDGLLGGLSMVTFSALAVLFALNGQTNLLLFNTVIIVSIIPYVLCNLGLIPKRKMKVFMGDSGSLFIGFTVIWLLIEGSQREFGPQMDNQIKPVTALWIIAIPLMDMAYTMLRRIRKQQSPFKADREHIHHVCERLGLSSIQTLVLICCIAVVFALIGVIGEIMQLSEMFMFIAFIVTFIGYYLCFTHIWKVTVFLRNLSCRIK
ncbi:undecaprenyl-phosphate alpha-N-acetylglucosaminyl 1-phosphate transferase [Psychromonas sp. psych-6C06]|uniref:UDP-N-acetylglucosamine--undecaprenyl-phosphate N-acetylglucosaminephosphotransferase n=1 Tax=Psychromonas sp. psych-6C06 TaxID=2058089 RepID=UPI000C32A8FE|nr:UDP-N-acetylglucosamine--undecaprenyl-phosphate N-acetylglucosaminephosphotransferase [Psychromonas sp. psych-6C06]PKF62523.1 undecaprenyl-phosphate alpha-N-acetylglucosaminyl 1-phosphate transferase [Psychromonas sp. psych-6C06]